MSKECLIENYQKSIGPFLSIKPNAENPQNTEMTFVPAVLRDNPLAFAHGLDLNEGDLFTQVKRFQQATCPRCGLCDPRVENISFNKVKIIRNNYRRQETPSFNYEVRSYIPMDPIGYRVTVIDDSAGTSNSLAVLLSSKGFYATSVVPSAPSYNRLFSRQLAKRVLETRPDAVITDKGLGFTSGFELTEEIRNSSDTYIPVIMLTGEPETNESREVHMDAFLVKPSTTTMVLNTLSRLLHIA